MSLLWVAAPMFTAVACQHQSTSSAPAATEAIEGPRFLVCGQVDKPGYRALVAGETVSQAVRDEVPASSGRYPMTIMLMRRGPEGLTRHVIDIGRSGQAVDPSKDIPLSDGDQLVFPTPSGQTPHSATEPSVGYR